MCDPKCFKTTTNTNASKYSYTHMQIHKQTNKLTNKQHVTLAFIPKQENCILLYTNMLKYSLYAKQFNILLKQIALLLQYRLFQIISVNRSITTKYFESILNSKIQRVNQGIVLHFVVSLLSLYVCEWLTFVITFQKIAH